MTTKPRRVQAILAFTGLLVVAGVLRLACSQGEAWLDEVWTWESLNKLSWPGGIFYQIRLEGNHYLNTFVVWLFRNQSWLYCRLPAVCCSVATVGLAWGLGRRHLHLGGTSAWLAAALTSMSYLMIHYGSEARGYAYAVFFAALGYLQLQASCSEQVVCKASTRAMTWKKRSAWPFAASCSAGFLAQPVFLSCFAAMGIWFFLQLDRLKPPRGLLPIFLRYFGPPAAFFAFLYTLDMRHAVNAGGEQYPLWHVIIETLSLAGGGPPSGWQMYLAATLVTLTFVGGLCVLAKRHDDRWVFYLMVVVVMPLVLFLGLGRAQVYPRYFLISVFFMIQSAAVALAYLTLRGPLARSVVALALVAYVWGNGGHVARLAVFGRGSYLPVIESMVLAEPSTQIQLRGDSDFRHTLMLKYYLPLANLHGRRFDYVARHAVPASGTEWLLTHSLDLSWLPPDRCRVNDVMYDLRSFRPYAGLSGWGLALYQRRPPSVRPVGTVTPTVAGCQPP